MNVTVSNYGVEECGDLPFTIAIGLAESELSAALS
jgi:hypothetical protein